MDTRQTDFLAALRAVLGDRRNKPVSLHEPEFAGQEWTYLRDCLDSGWVSTAGKYVERFERDLASFTGAAHVIAVVNGTAALHAALLAVDVRPGDEVLVPALTFVATANAVAHCGAIPHLVDSDPDRLGLDPLALEEYLARIAEPSAGGLRNRATGRHIAAVVPMHTFGHPVDMRALNALAAKLNIAVVEDAAESLGSSIDGVHTGRWGRIGTLSFNGNKTITTGGGGAILVEDAALAERVRHLTTTGKRPHRWEFFHDIVAYNYRLPNLNAALGCAQMEQLPAKLARKRRLAAAFQQAFAAKPGMHFVAEPAGCISNYWLNTVRVDNTDRATRDGLLQAAEAEGWQCRPVWTLMHHLPMYADCPRAPLPIAERLEDSLINLPSSAFLAADA
jgi:perosamine synthetase